MSLNPLNSVAIFTPYTVLGSLPSLDFIEFIFNLNSTNAPIIFVSDMTFILPITVLLVHQKTLNLSDSYENQASVCA